MESFGANSPRNLLRVLILITEVLLIILANELSYQLHAELSTQFKLSFFPFLGVSTLAWVSMGMLVGNYNMSNMFDPRSVLRTILGTFTLQAPLLYAFYYANNLYSDVLFPASHFLESSLFTLAFVGAFRYGMAQLYMHRKRLYRNYKAVIIGSGRSAAAVGDYLRSQSLEVYHFASDNGDATGLEAVESFKESIPSLKKLCLNEGIQEIYYTLPITDHQAIEEVWDFADNNYIAFKIANDFDLLNNKKVAISFFDQTPVISMKHVPLASRFNRLFKRVFDVIFSGLIMVTIFPIMYAIIGTLIKLDSPGPVFFRQARAGRKNQKFKVYKFRTMRNDPKAEFKQATKNDSRITKIGAFLRKTSLDEFPQFINVLKGEMSVVGPRPHPLKLDEMSAPNIDRYNARYWIKPGITGQAQANGYRGETNDPELMRKRVEFDNWYVENWSLALDLKLIIKTVTNVIQGEDNAY